MRESNSSGSSDHFSRGSGFDCSRAYRCLQPLRIGRQKCLFVPYINQKVLTQIANDAGIAVEAHLLHLVVLIVITGAYTLVLTKTLPKKQWKNLCKVGE